MIPGILAVNIGSATVKFAVFHANSLDLVERGTVTGFDAAPSVRLDGRFCPASPRALRLGDGMARADVACWLPAFLQERLPALELVAIGHRLVHGGARFREPVVVDPAVADTLASLAPMAPRQQLEVVAAIRAIARTHPALPHVACFDTAFHRSLPESARRLPLPRELHAGGVQRLGFHGLSYEYIASVLPVVAGPRAEGHVIVAHLAHSASVCALRSLRSVGTTMGFTPLDGLMMGTRSGSVDPGVVLHLIETVGMPVRQVRELLWRHSGLRGVSGISADAAVLEASADPRAREALELFAQRAAMEIAAQATLAGGFDALVFTGGIGEQSAAMRTRIADRLQWLGVRLDPEANAAHLQRITGSGSPVPAFVVHANEELVIARAVARLCGNRLRAGTGPATHVDPAHATLPFPHRVAEGGNRP